jgi:alkanesulfonate monooxygenase SsuD/methylene tetrahydromethanopterin reductase-like flavin-dependent oxidoreductase (luciferase family)
MGHDLSQLRVNLAGHMHIEEESGAARKSFYPYYAAYFASHAPKRSYLANVSREEYEKRAGAEGPLFVGSPQEIVDKISWEHELFGHQRYLAQVDIGGQPYAMVAKTLELLGTRVAPAVRELDD